MDNANIVCGTCGHPAHFHESLFGLPMGCDFCESEMEETYPRSGEGVSGIVLCGCDDFVPVVLPERVEVN